jgi:hypothetical protein
VAEGGTEFAAHNANKDTVHTRGFDCCRGSSSNGQLSGVAVVDTDDDFVLFFGFEEGLDLWLLN